LRRNRSRYHAPPHRADLSRTRVYYRQTHMLCTKPWACFIPLYV
jgi:hypothetical protein